eukprot:g980.t1
MEGTLMNSRCTAEWMGMAARDLPNLTINLDTDVPGGGGIVWEAACVLSKIFANGVGVAEWWSAQAMSAPMRMLELGSGTGACGLLAHAVCQQRLGGRGVHTLLTDMHTEALLRENIAGNRAALSRGAATSRIEAARLEWDQPGSALLDTAGGPWDIILGSDITYDESEGGARLHALIGALRRLCASATRPHRTRVLLAHTHRDAGGGGAGAAHGTANLLRLLAEGGRPRAGGSDDDGGVQWKMSVLHTEQTGTDPRDVWASKHEVSVDISLSAILGSAAVAFGLIPPLCCLTTPGRTLRLRVPILARDVLAFSFSLALLMAFFDGGEITLLESAALFACFSLYMAAVFLPTVMGGSRGVRQVKQHYSHVHDTLTGGDEGAPRGVGKSTALVPGAAVVVSIGDSSGEGALGSVGGGGGGAGAGGADEDDLRAGLDPCAGADTGVEGAGGRFPATARCLGHLMSAVEAPLRCVLPDPSTAHAWPRAFLGSVCGVALLSGVLLAKCTALAHAWGVSKEIVGAIVVAFGSQVPDIAASVSMARHGMASGALSNAIGSQVVSITVGAGVPFLVYNLATGRAIRLQMEDVSEVGVCLSLTVAVFLLCLAAGLEHGLATNYGTYAEQGFAGALHVLSGTDANEVLLKLDEYEASLGGAGALKGNWRFKIHLLLPWAAELVRHPVLVDAARAVLGTPDVLVWSSDVNSKPAQSAGHFAWHQDHTYAGIEPGFVTFWLALTQATEASGALRFAAGSHRRGQLAHTQAHEGAGGDSGNMLALGQQVPAELVRAAGGDDARVVELLPGEVSAHSSYTLHCSGPNSSAVRRVGLAIRYISAEAAKLPGLAREGATLVCGEDKFGHFELE